MMAAMPRIPPLGEACMPQTIKPIEQPSPDFCRQPAPAPWVKKLAAAAPGATKPDKNKHKVSCSHGEWGEVKANEDGNGEETQLDGPQTVSPTEANTQDQDPDSDSGASTQIDCVSGTQQTQARAPRRPLTQLERERPAEQHSDEHSEEEGGGQPRDMVPDPRDQRGTLSAEERLQRERRRQRRVALLTNVGQRLLEQAEEDMRHSRAFEQAMLRFEENHCQMEREEAMLRREEGGGKAAEGGFCFMQRFSLGYSGIHEQTCRCC
ncbi:uncharacterized protein LOC143831165 [Paroedura picta]|uniref:uncharacterized protein LOC143831165 n=1 Tax=Paroedura picta TaxID=143630 RepID=UPI0040561B40